MSVGEAVRDWLRARWRRHESRAEDLHRIDEDQADRDRRVANLELQLRVQLRRWGEKPP